MITSRVLTLPAWNGSSDLDYQTMLSGQEACEGESRGRWRIIELLSQTGKPFEAKLAWTAGNGGNLHTRITVAHATRVGLFARYLDVRIANLASAENTVSGVVAPARTFVQTHNQFEIRGDKPVPHLGALTDLYIPPFAERLHFYLTDYASRASWAIAVTDAQGVLRSYTTADTIPDEGLCVGGAGLIQVSGGAQTGQWRAVFTLSL